MNQKMIFKGGLQTVDTKSETDSKTLYYLNKF